MKCTSMKHILALLSWGQICILKEPEAFTFAKMEVGHPVRYDCFVILELLSGVYKGVQLPFLQK